MPEPEKLSEVEIARLKRRKPAGIDLTRYLEYLATLKPGDWGWVKLEGAENITGIKRRLTMAAKQKGLDIRYKKLEGDRIVFKVKEA